MALALGDVGDVGASSLLAILARLEGDDDPASSPLAAAAVVEAEVEAARLVGDRLTAAVAAAGAAALAGCVKNAVMGFMVRRCRPSSRRRDLVYTRRR